ncbi:HAMP domain protein, partial [Vibrio parahaemolyticus VPTS-2010_2]
IPPDDQRRQFWPSAARDG